MSRIGCWELAHGQTYSSEDVYGERRDNEQRKLRVVGMAHTLLFPPFSCFSPLWWVLLTLFFPPFSHFLPLWWYFLPCFFHLFLAFRLYGGIFQPAFSTFFSLFAFMVVSPTLLLPPFQAFYSFWWDLYFNPLQPLTQKNTFNRKHTIVI